MQHRDGAGRALQLPIVAGEGAQRFPTATHQGVVDHRLVRPGQQPEFRRQGEGQQEVLRRHLLLQLPFQPLLAFMMLAVRAMSMAAGVRDQ